MALSPKEVLELGALAKEHQELRDARLSILDTWNQLENEMVQLLQTCAGTDDPIIASIIYFSPHSFPTRTDIITKLINHLVISGARSPDLKTTWDSISRKLKRKKNARNYAAHGHIMTYADASGKNQSIIGPIMGQMEAHLNAYRKGRPPGVTLNEVKTAIAETLQMTDEIRAYRAKLDIALGGR